MQQWVCVNTKETPFTTGTPFIIDICSEFKNVYVDLAGDYFNNGLIEFLVKTIGSDKVLFGSDVNWIDPRCNLGPILSAKIKDEDKTRILRLNAIKAFPVSAG